MQLWLDRKKALIQAREDVIGSHMQEEVPEVMKGCPRGRALGDVD